ncbi:MAG: TQXA domain-containing protein, partial [Microbacterium sp.]
LTAPAAFAAIGDELAIVEVKGSGLAHLWVFSDGSAGYCLDMDKAPPRADATMREADWDTYYGAGQPWNEDPTVRGKVLWVLSHSYPALTAEEVSELTGLPAMTESELITATQYAIWSFTNGKNWSPDFVAGLPALYGWLTDNATPIQPNSPDGGSVDLEEGPGFTNIIGQPIGPFEVSADDIAVVNVSATAGATVVDAAGAPVSSARDGEEVWLDADAPVSATITAEGTYVHHTGRIWTYPPAPAVYQELSMGSAQPIIRRDAITVEIVDETPVPEPPVLPEPSVTPEPPVTPEPVDPPVVPEVPVTPEEPAAPEEPDARAPAKEAPLASGKETAKLAVTGGELPSWLTGSALAALGVGAGLLVAIRRRTFVER